MTGRPRSLAVGATVAAVMALSCVIGPWLLPDTGDGDPQHAALLPPGSLVTVLELADGRTLLAPQMQRADNVYLLTGQHGTTEVSVDEVRAQRRTRLWLGSDRFGRDLLPRFLIGGQLSLAVAALGVTVALIMGFAVGLAAVAGGRTVDALLMRLVDALLAFPVLLLLVLASALFDPGPVLLVLVLGLTSWMGLARLVRGQVLSLQNRTFVLAARVSGSSELRIWGLHYLPNLKAPVAQDTALAMGNLVLAEATLSFLGLGLPANLPSWGAMVAEGQRTLLDGWWLSVFPGLAITLLVVSLSLIGDGLQQRGRAST